MHLPTVAAALPDAFPHGGGVEAAARAWGCEAGDILDLSTGLHPDGAPTWLGEWLKAHASLVARYPDAGGEPARGALADAFDVRPENVLVCAGAQAVIEVVFQAMGWISVAMEIPCYNEPIRCATRADCRVLPFACGDAVPEAQAVWWTSPGNPSGRAEPFPAERTGLLDESYMPFKQRCSLGVMDGVIRLGSLTKSFCIPGLRLGYVVADAESVRKIAEWLPPWPAPSLALHLLPELLREAGLRDERIVLARQRLIRLLEKHGWQVQPSEASFVLARSADGLPDFARHRILLREFPEWPQLSGWLRFGLPGEEVAWRRLEMALQESVCR